MLTVLSSKPARIVVQPTSQTIWPVTVRPLHGTAAAQSTDDQRPGHGNHVVRVCHVEPQHGSSRPSARLTTDHSSAASDGGKIVATVITCYPTQPRYHRMAMRTSTRRCLSVGYVSVGSWFVWITTEYQTSDGWRCGRGKALLSRVRTRLDGLSRARLIVVQLAHRRERLDIGREQAGWVVQTGKKSSRAVNEALVRFGEGVRSKATSA